MKVNVQNRQQLLVTLTVALMGLLIADWIVRSPRAPAAPGGDRCAATRNDLTL